LSGFKAFNHLDRQRAKILAMIAFRDLYRISLVTTDCDAL
jgi:hypothetical protein